VHLNFLSPEKFKKIETPIKVPVYKDGPEIDLTFALLPRIVILSSKIVGVWGCVPGAQFLEVEIEKITKEKYYLMLISTFCDCVDEEKSWFDVYRKGDSAVGNNIQVGDYRPFYRLRIDPKRAEGQDLFRLERSRHTVIGSRHLKRLYDSINATGCDFQPVVD